MGVELSEMHVLRDILYADDSSFTALEEAKLQRLCDALREFCDSEGMAVNVQKTEAVVF